MDRSERVNNPSEMFRLAMEANQTRVWTALPGVVAKFPGSAGGAMTVDVQPTINGIAKDTLGKNSFVQMPVLLDCPLLFQGGGGATMTFPIAVGNECLVIFSSRCIDAWWQLGGIQNPLEIRMHNLSDGFALVGVRSLPNSYAVDTANVCLISDDQSTYIKMNPAGKTIAAHAANGLNFNGATIDSSGNIATPGNVTATGTVTGTADVKNGAGTSLTTHYHTAGGPVPIPGS